MAFLPESLVLSGPIDMAIVITSYPDVLVKDFNTPGYDCAAVSWKSADYSFDLRAYYDWLGSAYDDYSSGVVFLG